MQAHAESDFEVTDSFYASSYIKRYPRTKDIKATGFPNAWLPPDCQNYIDCIYQLY